MPSCMACKKSWVRIPLAPFEKTRAAIRRSRQLYPAEPKSSHLISLLTIKPSSYRTSRFAAAKKSPRPRICNLLSGKHLQAPHKNIWGNSQKSLTGSSGYYIVATMIQVETNSILGITFGQFLVLRARRRASLRQRVWAGHCYHPNEKKMRICPFSPVST